MSTHTPGPWTDTKLGNNADQYEVHAGDEGRTIAVTHDDEGGDNARLIAAAPDLLKEAQEVVDYMNLVDLDNPPNWTSFMFTLWEKGARLSGAIYEAIGDEAIGAGE